MSNNFMAPVPPIDPDDSDLEVGTVVRNGEVHLDADVSDDLVNSAQADRLASTADLDDTLEPDPH